MNKEKNLWITKRNTLQYLYRENPKDQSFQWKQSKNLFLPVQKIAAIFKETPSTDDTKGLAADLVSAQVWRVWLLR
jgi:hypothetical protein